MKASMVRSSARFGSASMACKRRDKRRFFTPPALRTSGFRPKSSSVLTDHVVLVVGDHGLGDGEPLGELLLREAALFTQLRDARADRGVLLRCARACSIHCPGHVPLSAPGKVSGKCKGGLRDDRFVHGARLSCGIGNADIIRSDRKPRSGVSSNDV